MKISKMFFTFHCCANVRREVSEMGWTGRLECSLLFDSWPRAEEQGQHNFALLIFTLLQVSVEAQTKSPGDHEAHHKSLHPQKKQSRWPNSIRKLIACDSFHIKSGIFCIIAFSESFVITSTTKVDEEESLVMEGRKINAKENSQRESESFVRMFFFYQNSHEPINLHPRALHYVLSKREVKITMTLSFPSASQNLSAEFVIHIFLSLLLLLLLIPIQLIVKWSADL